MKASTITVELPKGKKFIPNNNKKDSISVVIVNRKSILGRFFKCRIANIASTGKRVLIIGVYKYELRIYGIK